jgi:hypothetical protein
MYGFLNKVPDMAREDATYLNYRRVFLCEHRLVKNCTVLHEFLQTKVL